MKTFKPIFKAFTLILLLAFASCKKDGAVKPGPDANTTVTSGDLLDYSIVAYLNVDEGLRLFYFNKDGNDIKATFDAVNARRILTANVVNNTLVFDLNGDGSVIYTFKFTKNEKGRVLLTSADYKKQDDASIQIQKVFNKNSDLSPLAGLKFSGHFDVLTYLKFSTDHNFAISTKPDYAGAGWASYYDLCPGAWKGTYNGVNYMGISIKPAPNEPEQMYVQKAGAAKTYTLNAQ